MKLIFHAIFIYIFAVIFWAAHELSPSHTHTPAAAATAAAAASLGERMCN